VIIFIKAFLLVDRVDGAQVAFEFLERAPILYMKQTDEKKARLLKTLLPNCWIRDKNLEPIYKKQAI